MMLWVAVMAAMFLISACGSKGGGGGNGTPSYTVGGTLSGLTGTVVLQNNESDDLTITADGAFTFATKVADGGAYSVTVLTQPATQTCTASSNTGTIAGADVTSVSVVCSVNTYNVGGTISGLTGTVVLQNNGADDLSVVSNGTFTFATKVAEGGAYAVTVKTWPFLQKCIISNGTGTIAGANVTNVTVACASGPSKLAASDGAANDDYGGSVSVSGNGTTVVVGSTGSTVGANAYQGSAYVYIWSGSAWTETKLVASDGAASNQFGCSVAISSDGSTVVVGTNGPGKVYVYKWSGSAWVETKLTASDGKQIGDSVAVSSDGTTVVAAASTDDIVAVDQGSVYVFKWSGSAWTETKLVASDGAAYDYLGGSADSLSVSSDGNTVVAGSESDDIGANASQGSAYIFKWNGSAWAETKLTASDGTANDYYGESVDISTDGLTVVVGAPNANKGVVYIYKFSGSSWGETKLIASDEATKVNSSFGNYVSVSSDGQSLAVGDNSDGSFYQGSAYVYKWNGSAWIETKLTAADGAASDYYGQSVAISSDGSTVAVGAKQNANNGAAYVY